MLSKSAPIFEMPRLARVAGYALIAAVCLLLALPLPARADASPDAALTQLLAAAHAEATPGKCAERGIDRLVRIMCSGHIRIGVRDEYPLFATHSGATWQGYEIDIARAVGKPTAFRAVGMANNRNPIAIVVPCHRVIASDGTLCGYGGGLDVKRKLLELEGALTGVLAA